MPTNRPTTEQLTREEIRRQLAHYDTLDRQLTERLAEMYRNGQTGASISALGEREKAVHARAKQILNGHAGYILPSKPDGQDEGAIFLERSAIRLITEALNRKDVEAAAVEALEWANAHKSEFLALIKDWSLAAVRFQALEARVQHYRESAGEAGHALPLSNLVAGTGVTFELGAWTTLADQVDAAVAGGALSAADVRKARRVEAAS